MTSARATPVPTTVHVTLIGATGAEMCPETRCRAFTVDGRIFYSYSLPVHTAGSVKAFRVRDESGSVRFSETDGTVVVYRGAHYQGISYLEDAGPGGT